MANPEAEDVPGLFEDLGVEISIGGPIGNGGTFIGGGSSNLPLETTKGFVDRSGERVLDSDSGLSAVIATSIVVTIQKGSLPGLGVGAVIKVDGELMKVNSILPVDDGEIVHLLCQTA